MGINLSHLLRHFIWLLDSVCRILSYFAIRDVIMAKKTDIGGLCHRAFINNSSNRFYTFSFIQIKVSIRLLKETRTQVLFMFFHPYFKMLPMSSSDKPHDDPISLLQAVLHVCSGLTGCRNVHRYTTLLLPPVHSYFFAAAVAVHYAWLRSQREDKV